MSDELSICHIDNFKENYEEVASYAETKDNSSLEAQEECDHNERLKLGLFYYPGENKNSQTI